MVQSIGKFSHNAHKHCLWLCLQARAFKPGSSLNLRVIHVRDHGTACLSLGPLSLSRQMLQVFEVLLQQLVHGRDVVLELRVHLAQLPIQVIELLLHTGTGIEHLL